MSADDGLRATRLSEPYLSALAAPAPTPGGGSASAVTAAMAAALLEMVAGISLTSASGDQAGRLTAFLDDVRDARQRCLALGEDDERAYAAYRTASGLPKGSPEEKAARRNALASATMVAATPPLDLTGVVAAIADRAAAIVADTSPYLTADLVTATALLQAAGQGAMAMVDVNVRSIKDESVRAAWLNDAAHANAALDRALADLRASLGRRT
jgi:methenyltetrahydrofolate cyclohydrolase